MSFPIDHLTICANDTALTNEQRQKLLEIETELCMIYGIPTIFSNTINHYFIYLYCSNEQEQLRRIITRGRKAEIKIYRNIYDLHPINHAYEDYYDRCNERKRILNQGLNI